MAELKVGSFLPVKSYKHQGLLHRTWQDGYLLDVCDDYFIVGSRHAKIIESNGSVWYTKEPAITFYSRKHWFNIVCMFKGKNGEISYYANIASPTVYDEFDHSLKFVDYDLDIRMDKNGKIRVADMAEYRLNRRQLNYSPQVIKVVEDTVFELINKGNSSAFPFLNSFFEPYFKKLPNS